MVQGNLKKSKGTPNNNRVKSAHCASVKKAVAKTKAAKLGSVIQLPNKHFRQQAMDERELSKAIDKANEQKVAAKLVQGGGKLATKDILQRGKELNRQQRRSQVKKKLTRVEEKLRDLKAKAEKEGLI